MPAICPSLIMSTHKHFTSTEHLASKALPLILRPSQLHLRALATEKHTFKFWNLGGTFDILDHIYKHILCISMFGNSQLMCLQGTGAHEVSRPAPTPDQARGSGIPQALWRLCGGCRLRRMAHFHLHLSWTVADMFDLVSMQNPTWATSKRVAVHSVAFLRFLL